MTMVERVAKAIYEGRNGRGCTPWARLPQANRAPYLSDAIAALREIRYPSNDAIVVFDNVYGDCHTETAWRAAIDFEIAAYGEGR